MMPTSNTSPALLDSLLLTSQGGAEACQQLAQLSDRIVADAGGELSVEERGAIERWGLDVGAAERARRKSRTDDVVAGLMSLAARVPGAGERIIRFTAQFQQTAALSARAEDSALPATSFGSPTVPTVLTAFDLESCAKYGMDPAVALRAAQAEARARLR